MSNKVTIKDKKYRLPRGWQLMTPEWLSRLSGIPLEELVPEEERNLAFGPRRFGPDEEETKG